ncbi:MAG: glycogen-binding domain-containing protein [Balneolaceae bacterium]
MSLKSYIMVISTVLVPILSQSQDIQMTFMSELRAGYSTNTYLNPFFSEWDRTYNSGYGLASTFGQLSWDKENHNVEVSGGYVYEPFFDNQATWRGYLAYAKYVGQLKPNIHAGVNIGTSSFQSNFTRSLHWVQPFVTWFPSAFTSLNLKVGSNLREYVGYQDSLNSKNRIDSYALEIESWPAFRWQLKAGLYGSLENIPAIQDGLSAAVSVSHLFPNGSKITSELQFINYNSEATVTIDSGNEPGPPPTGPPTHTTDTQTISDQIFKLKLEGAYPLKKNISIFIASENSFYQSSAIENSIGDVQISGGIRFNLNPTLPTSGKNYIEPKWMEESDKQSIRVKYRGKGNLFLIGDFNNWEKPGIPLIEVRKNNYKTEMKLETGLYEYRILLINGTEEEWLEFSNNVYTIKDSFDGTNAVLTVE